MGPVRRRTLPASRKTLVGWVSALPIIAILGLLLPSLGGAASARVLGPGGATGPPRLDHPATWTPSAWQSLARSGVVQPAALARAGGIGHLAHTLVLVNNSLIPSSGRPAVLSNPTQGYFDATNNKLYVVGSTSSVVAIVDGSSNSVRATLTTGYSPVAIANDSATGDVYVATSAGDVVVINGTTDRISKTIGVGFQPAGIAYDPGNGDLYVSNSGSANVSVISGASRAVVATIAVGTHPGAIVYDPGSTNLFVANLNSANVSVINTATNKVLLNPAVGSSPGALVVDTVNDYVDVANSGSHNVSILSGLTGFVAATVAVGSDPFGLAFDPLKKEVIVTNAVSSNVSVINQTALALNATVAVCAGPEQIAIDGVTQKAYVVCSGASALNGTILDLGTNMVRRSITTANLPRDVVFDSANGNTYVVNYATVWAYHTDNLTEISGSTDLPIASVDLSVRPWGMAYDGLNNNLYVTAYNAHEVYVVNGATNAVAAVVPVGIQPIAACWGNRSGDVYIAEQDHNVSAVNPTTNTVVATIPSGYLTWAIACDPRNGDVYVANALGNITVIDQMTNAPVKSLATTAVAAPEGIVYDAANGNLYVGNSGSDNISVINGSTNTWATPIPTYGTTAPIVFDPNNGYLYAGARIEVVNPTTGRVLGNITGGQFTALNPVNNALYTANGGGSTTLSVFNASSYALQGTFQVGAYTQGVLFDAGNQGIYVDDGIDGGVSIITFASNYNLYFNETGLPSGTSWSVTVNGITHTSSTSSISFTVANGSYTFLIGAVPGYLGSPATGTLSVSGRNVVQNVSFSPVVAGSYVVTFNGVGLPPGTLWNVTLNGVSHSSTTSSIQFSEPNGTYTFLVANASGYVPAPATGSVTVSGMAVNQSISFTRPSGVPPLTVGLDAAPRTLSLGQSLSFHTTASGGVGPYIYSYSSLPAGCSTADLATLPCTPTAVGTYRITVSVLDSSGARGENSTTVVVLGSGSGGTGMGHPPILTTTEIVVIGAFALAIILILLFASWRRTERPPPQVPPGVASPPSQPSKPAATSGGPPASPPPTA